MGRSESYCRRRWDEIWQRRAFTAQEIRKFNTAYATRWRGTAEELRDYINPLRPVKQFKQLQKAGCCLIENSRWTKARRERKSAAIERAIDDAYIAQQVQANENLAETLRHIPELQGTLPADESQPYVPYDLEADWAMSFV
jgi:hypothetical protein